MCVYIGSSENDATFYSDGVGWIISLKECVFISNIAKESGGAVNVNQRLLIGISYLFHCNIALIKDNVLYPKSNMTLVNVLFTFNVKNKSGNIVMLKRWCFIFQKHLKISHFTYYKSYR
jgi:predicted outer membrane repeat protein